MHPICACCAAVQTALSSVADRFLKMGDLIGLQGETDPLQDVDEDAVLATAAGFMSCEGAIFWVVCWSAHLVVVCACVYVYVYVYTSTHTQAHNMHSRRTGAALPPLLWVCCGLWTFFVVVSFFC